METVERVPLSLSERRHYAYRYTRIADYMQTSAERAEWDHSKKDCFHTRFEKLRLSCFTPAYMSKPDNPDFYLYQNKIEALYKFKRAGEICPICIEADDNDSADSITKCGHVFCFKCYENYFNYSKKKVNREMVSKCPCCNKTSREPCDELIYVSTKFNWVINRVRQLLDEWKGQANVASKIVIISSSAGFLVWFDQAMMGLGISSMFCEEYNADGVKSFLADVAVNRVLLLTPWAIQTEITLPPSSHTIVTEAIVYDVKQHIFGMLKTSGVDSLMKTILIAENTVEEYILAEPHYVDYYESFDTDGTFIGPNFNPFKNVERLASLIESSPEPDLDLDLLDEQEEEGEDDLDSLGLDLLGMNLLDELEEEGEGGGGGEGQ